MDQKVSIETGSRLHFGMLSFGRADVRRFGGVGLMVDEPHLRIVVHPERRFTCTGRHAERAEQVATKVARHWLGGRMPPCRMAVHDAPLAHRGLGLGTQLSLAVAMALLRFCKVAPLPSAAEIAVQLSRAERSSVGTHGFEQGGLLVEAGHDGEGGVGPLIQRVALPEAWHVLLVTPREIGGLSGTEERQAFQHLPPVPVEVTGQLAAEVLLELLPSARNRDFEAFSRSVYRFGRVAGSCFDSVQGGPYSPVAAPLIERLRSWGVEGVGQSSWGPTVFALACNAAAAETLRRRLDQEPGCHGMEITIARVCNRGAFVRAGDCAGGRDS